MLDIAVWSMSGKHRSQVIATALEHGAHAAGHKAKLRDDAAYKEPIGDVAAFYGYQKCFPRMMAEYLAAGKAVVFVDLGYWGRHTGGRFRGYHKVSVGGRHPTDYIMNRKRDPSRLTQLGIRKLPWQKTGRDIIVAGMSDKSAASYGLKPEEWERQAIVELRKHTTRPIIYRPKPSWRGAKPIHGSTFQKTTSDLVFTNVHAVVTHHSNLAIDALQHGVPAFCWDGAAKCMSLQDLSKIESPLRPRGRDQWMNNLAWCQWNVGEMKSGQMWRHLESDGFIP